LSFPDEIFHIIDKHQDPDTPDKGRVTRNVVCE